MTIYNLRETLIKYIENSINNDLEFQNDKIKVDKAYNTDNISSSSVFVYIMDNYESKELFEGEGISKFTFQIYTYGKKTKHNGTLVGADDMCTLLNDFIINIFKRENICNNINNIISLKRTSTSPILPLDDSFELYYSAVRYEIEL